jgi:hypothetical protein
MFWERCSGYPGFPTCLAERSDAPRHPGSETLCDLLVNRQSTYLDNLC